MHLNVHKHVYHTFCFLLFFQSTLLCFFYNTLHFSFVAVSFFIVYAQQQPTNKSNIYHSLYNQTNNNKKKTYFEPKQKSTQNHFYTYNISFSLKQKTFSNRFYLLFSETIEIEFWDGHHHQKWAEFHTTLEKMLKIIKDVDDRLK